MLNDYVPKKIKNIFIFFIKHIHLKLIDFELVIFKQKTAPATERHILTIKLLLQIKT